MINTCEVSSAVPGTATQHKWSINVYCYCYYHDYLHSFCEPVGKFIPDYFVCVCVKE